MESNAYHELSLLEPDHWWYRGMRHITHQVLNSLGDQHHSLRILDAGCGVGGNLNALGYLGRVYGIDYSVLALDYARRSHAGKITRATVEALPYGDGVFDLVTSFDVLYCWEVKNDIQALAEFARVLCPGGYALVRVPALPALRGPHDSVVHGIRRYTAVELRQKLECVGLQPLRLTYLNSLLLPLIFVIRQLQSLVVRMGATPHSDVQPASPTLNRLLYKVLALEAWWISRGHQFPLGVSLLCLAIKPIGHNT